MAKFANIQDAAVVPYKEPSGQMALIGYFTAKDGTNLSTGELRSFLLDKLPSYYVPKRLSQLDEMPLSPTGKVDRKKLASYELPVEERPPADPNMQPRSKDEALIAHAWEEALGGKGYGTGDDFFQIGGDSLAAIQVLVHLKPHCPSLSIQDLFQYKTIGQLVERMERLRREEQLRPEEQSVPSAARGESVKVLSEFPRFASSYSAVGEVREPECILLTGATGYLGSYMLYELLRKSRAKVIALVRGSRVQAGSRLQEVMKRYFGEGFGPLLYERVQVLEGNLEASGLGLPEQDLAALRSQVDTIIHAAADVRHFGSADQIERANVLGTAQLLEFAESVPGIRFHFISTISVPEELASEGQWEAVERTNEYAADLRVRNVYANSKLQAEKLVLEAAKRGLAVNVFRPANLTCHSLTGKFQINIDSNAFYRMIKAMLLLGKAPRADWHVDLTPID
jgi:nucleoside-diphosphate-sugar epimerase